MQFRSKCSSSYLYRPIVAALLLLPCTHVAAQEAVEFLDDFSADSIKYILDERPRDGVVRSFEKTTDGITMRVSTEADNNQGWAEIRLSEVTDHVRAIINLSSETELADENGGVRFRIAGNWYNEIQDGGFGGRDETGDVYGQARIRVREQGDREFSMCLDRRLADGSNEGVEIFDGRNCTAIPGFVPEYDTDYEIYMAVDRTANTIAFGIDGQEIVTAIGQQAYLPSRTNKQIELAHEGTSGQSVGTVSGIGIDGELQNFSVDPFVSGPYRPLFDTERGTSEITHMNGRVRYEVRAPADSTSIVGAPVMEGDDAFVFARLGGTFYNDTAEGGFNENEGNVFSAIVLQQNADDSVVLQYCIFRSDTNDFSAATELVMQDGTECGDFTTVAELDTSYNVGIASDIVARTMTFKVNDEEIVYNIATEAFLPANDRQFINVQARATAGGKSVVYLDNYGTSADAPLVNQAAASTSGGSSGGGGCSVVSGNNSRDPFLLVLSLFALITVSCKRRRSSMK